MTSDFPQLDRLTRYHGHHERTFYRALKELKALQTAREIQARLANPNKADLLLLADLAQVQQIGFVSPGREKSTSDVSQLLQHYLSAPPPGQ